MGDKNRKKKKEASANLAESKSFVLIKLRGMFYNAFSDSARVLSYVTGFKVKQTSETAQPKCGFPSGSLDKVAAILKDNDISFEIYNKDERVAFNDAGENNRYDEILFLFDENNIIKAWENGAGKPDVAEKISEDNSKEKTVLPAKKESVLKRLFHGRFLAVCICFGIFAGVLSVCLYSSSSRATVEADSVSDTTFADIDSLDIEVCDYSTIPIAVNLPSTVSEEDVDAYMDKVLENYEGGETHESITDEYCSANLGVSSVDEFRSELKNDMYSYKNDYVDGYIDGAVKYYVIEKSSFNIPDDVYEEMFENRLNQQIAFFINQYCDGDRSKCEEKVAELTVYESVADLEDFLKETVEDTFELNLFYEAVAEKEGISCEGDEYDSWLSDTVSSQGFESKDKLFSFYDTEYESGEDFINHQFIYSQVSDLLLDNVSLTYDEDALVTDLLFSEEQGG